MSQSPPLVHLPTQMQLILRLLAEDLKANYFFHGLARLSLHDCWYQPFLGSVVFTLLQFDDHDDHLMDFYMTRLQYHSRHLEPGRKVVMKRALRLYEDLRQEKQRRLARHSTKKMVSGGTGTWFRHPGSGTSGCPSR